MIDNKTAPYGALAIRVSLGTMFLSHALLKILVFTPAGTVGYFKSLGLPGFIAYIVIAAELLAGTALIGTIVLVHGANGWLFSNKGGGWEYPLFLIMASLALGLLGDGAYALVKSRTPFRS